MEDVVEDKVEDKKVLKGLAPGINPFEGITGDEVVKEEYVYKGLEPNPYAGHKGINPWAGCAAEAEKKKVTTSLETKPVKGRAEVDPPVGTTGDAVVPSRVPTAAKAKARQTCGAVASANSAADEAAAAVREASATLAALVLAADVARTKAQELSQLDEIAVAAAIEEEAALQGTPAVGDTPMTMQERAAFRIRHKRMEYDASMLREKAEQEKVKKEAQELAPPPRESALPPGGSTDKRAYPDAPWATTTTAAEMITARHDARRALPKASSDGASSGGHDRAYPFPKGYEAVIADGEDYSKSQVKRMKRSAAGQLWDKVKGVTKHRRSWDTLVSYRVGVAAMAGSRYYSGSATCSDHWVPADAEDTPAKHGLRMILQPKWIALAAGADLVESFGPLPTNIDSKALDAENNR